MKKALVMAAAAALVGAAGQSLAGDAMAPQKTPELRPVPHKPVIHKKVVRPAKSHGVIYHPAKVVPKVHRVEDAPDFRA